MGLTTCLNRVPRATNPVIRLAGFWYTQLPSTISELKNLTHLDVSDCEVLQSLPLEVINLKLQLMKGLVIGNSIFNLTNLKQWDKLRKLSINFGNKVAIEEEELGELEHLRSLTTLTIACWVKSGKLLKTNLNWLPKGLEKLDLRCFPLKELPSGLKPKKLKNLKRLYLRGGKLQSLKGPEVEGHKWQVEILRLRYLNELKENCSTLSRLFPGLKYVDIYECTKIKPFPIDLGGLDKQLKSCLLSLSIFPNAFEISRRKLVYWWIGEGFVEPTNEKTAEQVRQDCFLKLTEQGLIESIPKERNIQYRLSPYIQSKVVSLARASKLFDFDSKPIHKCLRTFNMKKSFSFSLTDELGVVINLNVQSLHFNNDAIRTLKNLTVLDLGAWSDETSVTIIENPDSFFECLHLLKRLICLGLERVRGIKEIPDTISELSELRVLNLLSCFDLERLSNDVVQLRKLTHLDMSYLGSLRSLMKLNDLEELQVVKGFSFNYSNPGDLSYLDKWKKLRKLSITFWDAQWTYVTLGGVKDLKSLRTLSIDFSYNLNRTLNDLRWLPPNLKKLDLARVTLYELPPQVVQNLSNLKRLYLRLCWLSSLKVFEGLKVQVLRLKNLYRLEMDWSEVRHIFPCLKYVTAVGCPKLTSFPGDKNGVWIKDKEKEGSSS